MGLSAILGPFTFFFILFVHVTIFCAVCVYYADAWLYSDFYHDIICSWTAKCSAAITGLYIASVVCSICMVAFKNSTKLLFPISNLVVSIALLGLTLALGYRTRRGFIKDFDIYKAKENDPVYASRYLSFKQDLCKDDIQSDDCKQKIIMYFHERSVQIGSHILALMLMFALIQVILSAKMIISYRRDIISQGLDELSEQLMK